MMDNDTATGTGPQDPALTATQEGGGLGPGIARADTAYLSTIVPHLHFLTSY